MSKFINLYLAAPKVVTVYGFIAALINQEQDYYECLYFFRREWCKCVLSSDEVVAVQHSQAAVLSVGDSLHELADQFSNNYTFHSLQLPMVIKPLSSQLKTLTGEGYNCAWTRVIDSQGNPIGEVNHALKVAVAFHSVDLLKHSQRFIEADSSGFNLAPICTGYKFNLITPSVLGFVKESVTTMQDGEALAEQLRKWERTKHNRLTPA